MSVLCGRHGPSGRRRWTIQPVMTRCPERMWRARSFSAIGLAQVVQDDRVRLRSTSGMLPRLEAEAQGVHVAVGPHARGSGRGPTCRLCPAAPLQDDEGRATGTGPGGGTAPPMPEIPAPTMRTSTCSGLAETGLDMGRDPRNERRCDCQSPSAAHGMAAGQRQMKPAIPDRLPAGRTFSATGRPARSLHPVSGPPDRHAAT